MLVINLSTFQVSKTGHNNGMIKSMENLNPKLTIAIPTYNSRTYLPAVIDSLLNELAGIDSNLVEVLVSDNASTDGTIEYLVEKNLTKNFRLFQNSENLGFEAQIRKLTNLAKGEFLWILGSQDYLNKGGLSLILKKLQENGELTHCLLNFSIKHEDVNFQDESAQYIGISNKATTSVRNYFRFLGGPALAVSANLVRTSLMKDVQNINLLCKNWAHLEFIYCSIFLTKSKKEFHFIDKPVFTLFREVDGWWTTESVLEVYVELYELVSKRIPVPIIRWRQQYRKNGKILNGAIDNAVSTVELNINKELYVRILKTFRNFPTFWLFSYLHLRKSIR